MAENKGIISEFLDAAKDRISGQVTGTYILVWLIVNWRVPINLIYGSAEPEERIKAITLLYQNSFWSDSFSLFLLPFMITALYLCFVEILRFAHKEYSHYWNNLNEYRRHLADADLTMAVSYKQSVSNFLCSLSNELGDDLKYLERIQFTADDLHAASSGKLQELATDLRLQIVVLKNFIALRKEHLGVVTGANFRLSETIKQMLYALHAGKRVIGLSSHPTLGELARLDSSVSAPKKETTS